MARTRSPGGLEEDLGALVGAMELTEAASQTDPAGGEGDRTPPSSRGEAAGQTEAGEVPEETSNRAATATLAGGKN